MDKRLYDNYVTLLEHELVPALGCTEPIAVAFCAATAAKVLGKMPERVDVRCSGNIIKNVKGVTVPNSGGMKGIEAAAVLGIIGGDADRKLEVLQSVTDADRVTARDFLADGKCTTSLQEGEGNLYILCQLYAGEDEVQVEVKTNHDHISKIVKNGEVLHSQDAVVAEQHGDKSVLSLEGIYEFANTCEIDDVAHIVERQVEKNMALAHEGMTNQWGVNVGRNYLELSDGNVRVRAAATAAAGSDARMSGCSLPAVINSGSGNQGCTISLPIAVYAEELGVSREKKVRALVLANLISIHQKRFIGNLSCYCGATSAATAAVCGVAYMMDEPFSVICDTIVNSIATLGGMICDGAKASCATKIRTAVDNAIFAMELARRGQVFQEGDGVVGEDAEATIRNIGRVGRIGMAPTDIEVLNIMIGC